MKQFNHTTVLLNETINILNIKPNGIYIDCTLGGGGHSSEIAKILDKGTLVCVDKDANAINNFKNFVSQSNKNIFLVNDSFENILTICKKFNIQKVDGILFDLGVSSPQLDDPSRGFSYKNNSELDMRMDLKQEITAKKIVNEYSVDELTRIFRIYGDCKYALSVAKKIDSIRKNKEIATTLELVEIIKQSIPKKELFKPKHPARQYFQALRIEVNNEIDILGNAISDGIKLLNLNGVLAVISFHSLEDRIVKNIFKKFTTTNIPSYLPIKESDIRYKVVCKPITPNDCEIQKNARARSSKLRAIERICL